MKKILFLIVTGILIAVFTQAQVINLNNSVKTTENSTIPSEFLKEAKTARGFDINPALQSAQNVKIGDKVALQLFENQNYEAQISNITTDVNGTLALTLKFPEYPMGFALIITSKEGISLVNISIPELNQTFGSLYNTLANEYYLIEVDENIRRPVPLDNDAIAIPEGVEVFGPESQLRSVQAVDCGPDVFENPNAPATITLLIVYTPAAATSSYSASKGGINNVIANMIALGNTCMTNSQIGITLTLAYSHEVDYVENNDMSTSLNRLRYNGDGYMDEVHTWRKQYGAALVQLLSTDNNSGGLGNLLLSTKGNCEVAFSVCYVTQVGDTYPCSVHELGHNMGLGHGAQQISVTSEGIFSYSQGWRWTGNQINQHGNNQYVSVMSYSGNYYEDGITPAYTSYFSNPNVSYLGGVTGDAVRADAARSLREMKHVIASYSDRIPDVLDFPTNIVVSNPTANGATFSWDACPNATSYRFCRPTGNGGYSYFTTTSNSYTVSYSAWFPQSCTSYEIFIAAVNDCGDTATGQTITFTTACATDPTVQTLDATNVSNTSATLNKTVTANGAAIVSQGFKYKASSSSTWLTSTDGILNGLTPNTQYQFYAYASTSTNTVNGRVLTFATSSCDNDDQVIYTVEMRDAFGDGWNGGSLKIRQNGVDIKTVTLENSTIGESNVSLCACTPFELIWVKGQYDYECSFTIKDNNNTQIFATPAGSGSSSSTAGCAGYSNGQIVYSGETNCIKIWTPVASSTDWNNSGNWAPAGIPGEIYKVFIPERSSYPILTAPTTVAEIHFAPGAQIGGQSNLTAKAFVSYDLSNDKRDRWNMLSIPLGQVVPGDFVFGGYPTTWVRTFTTYTDGALTKGGWVTASGGSVSFSAGDGFMLWLNADGSEYDAPNKGLKRLGGILELPYFQNFEESSGDYGFYNNVNLAHKYDSGTQTSTFYNFQLTGSEYIRDESQNYNVIRNSSAYQIAKGNVSKTPEFADGSFALMGNPFMAALDFDEFCKDPANVGTIKDVYHIWINNAYESYSSTYGYLGTDENLQLTKDIAPLQGFIVEKIEESPYPSSQFRYAEVPPELTFKDSWAKVNKDVVLRSSASTGNRLDIVARNPEAGVRTLIAQTEGGQNEFSNLDARKIINEISKVPEIYTLKPYQGNSVAVSINVINNGDLLIPVGLATSYSGNITLTFSGMDSYNAAISLIDAETNRTIDLTGLASYEYAFNYTPKTINGEAAVCEDRFFIRISKSPTGLIETIAGKVNVFESNGMIRIVSGAANPVKEVSVFDLQGVLLYKEAALNAISHTVNKNLPAGAYIVKVVSEKNTDNVKLIKR